MGRRSRIQPFLGVKGDSNVSTKGKFDTALGWFSLNRDREFLTLTKYIWEISY